LERIGYEITVEDLLRHVLLDKPFFERSGGGVTMTGGEPTFQSEFLLALLDAFRQEDIHTAIETCGQYPAPLTSALAQVTNLFLFDLKHMDIDRHQDGTLAGNTQILANFSDVLGAVGAQGVIPRIPLIPGFNTAQNDIDAFINYLQDTGYNGKVHLMPYHRWARGKYDRLNRSSAFHDPGGLDEGELTMIAQCFANAGFEPVCHG